MQKIIAMLLALIMSLFGFIPAVQPADAYTQAEWYALVADEFKLTYDLDDGDNYDIAADDPYFQVVQACHDWNVLVGEYDADAAITDVLVAKSLAVAAGIGEVKAPNEAALNLAIDAGIVSIKFNFFGEVKESVISKEAANAALGTAKTIYLNRLAAVENGGTVTTENGIASMSDMSLISTGDGLTLQSADGSIINENDITALNYEGKVNPFEQPEAAGINSQSILEKINVSFSVGGLKVKAAVKDGGFDVSVGGNVKGVNITKSYQVRNFDLTTKFDGDLSEKQINEAYLLMDYDVTDTTTVEGSYAASLAEKDLPEGSDDVDFFAKVQNNLFELRSGTDNTITVFSVDVAIPNCPAITVGITAKLVISFDGRVELVLTSSESKGVYIEDNKVRTVSESTPGTTSFTAQARCEVTLSLGVNVKVVSIVIVDADVQVGLGVHVTAVITSGASNYKLDIPVDFLYDINLTYPNSENCKVVGNVKVYGIVRISVGQNSPILKKLGLKKTWTLVDESNGSFVDYDFTVLDNTKTA